MGCDIHLYVEYRQKSTSNWTAFSRRLSMARDYLIFAIMAEGVRLEVSEAFSARGLPVDIAWHAEGDSRLYITDDGLGEGETTLAQALNWEKQGCKIIYNRGGKPTWVTNPDHHSHSWLSTQEFKKSIDIYKERPKEAEYELDVDYTAVLALLEHFESRGYKARVVFWFDN